MNLGKGFSKTTALMAAACILLICFSACGRGNISPVSDTASHLEMSSQENEEQTTPGINSQKTNDHPSDSKAEETEGDPEMKTLTMKIGGTTVAVDWEKNDTVAALTELVKDKPLTIQMSMYGGFEQVGSLGTDLPRNDAQTTTQAGDIVLYSGNQIVVFYGSNSWAYTRLGHISDRSSSQMKDLLGKGNVTIELSME